MYLQELNKLTKNSQREAEQKQQKWRTNAVTDDTKKYDTKKSDDEVERQRVDSFVDMEIDFHYD